MSFASVQPTSEKNTTLACNVKRIGKPSRNGAGGWVDLFGVASVVLARRVPMNLDYLIDFISCFLAVQGTPEIDRGGVNPVQHLDHRRPVDNRANSVQPAVPARPLIDQTIRQTHLPQVTPHHAAPFLQFLPLNQKAAGYAKVS
jgi:hypothetical protein